MRYNTTTSPGRLGTRRRVWKWEGRLVMGSFKRRGGWEMRGFRLEVVMD